MNDPLDILDAVWTEALADRVQPTNESATEAMYRSYSITFHTPLEQARQLPIDIVARAVYAETVRNLAEEDFEEYLQNVINPSTPESEEESIQEFIKKAVEDEHKSNPSLYKKKDAKPKDNVDLPPKESQSLKGKSDNPFQFSDSGSKSYGIADESPSGGPSGLDSLEKALRVDQETKE